MKRGNQYGAEQVYTQARISVPSRELDGKSCPTNHKRVWQSVRPSVKQQRFDLYEDAGPREDHPLHDVSRYDTIRQVDRIVVLMDGRLVESGIHEELEQQAGGFWSLYLGQRTHPGTA